MGGSEPPRLLLGVGSLYNSSDFPRVGDFSNANLPSSLPSFCIFQGLVCFVGQWGSPPLNQGSGSNVGLRV